MQPYPPQSAPGLRGAPLDRASEKRKDANWIHSLYAQADWLPVWRYRSAISDGRPQFLRFEDLEEEPLQPIFLGLRLDNNRAVFCFDASADDNLAQRLQFADLRGSVPILSGDDAALLGYARAMIYWQRQHRHCGRCGARTEAQSAGHVLYCNDCKVEHYPRSDPSMLCLVTDPQDRALLGRQPQWPTSLYSVLAGFSEPGETIEDCVAREIWEEARVKVTGTRYIASQPWPFPASVLLGFIASSEGEAPQTSQDELDAADWFSRADIAEGIRSGELHIPPPFTLSHHLIRTWFDAGSDMPLSGYFNPKG